MAQGVLILWIPVTEGGSPVLDYLITFVDDEADRQKFTAIYQEYHAKMEKVALRILSDQKDAEDAVQNAWIQVIENFSKISKITCGELLFWLVSITKNEALMILRKKRKTVPLEEWDAPTEVPNHDMNYQELVALFTRLPETYRATLEMKFLLQYTDREIAVHLGISETAVSTRVNRGRTLLREFVSQCIKAGGVPRDSTWKKDSSAWISTSKLAKYMVDNGYATKESYTNTNAGNFATKPGHSVLVSINNTVDVCYTAHNRNRKDAPFGNTELTSTYSFYVIKNY